MAEQNTKEFQDILRLALSQSCVMDGLHWDHRRPTAVHTSVKVAVVVLGFYFLFMLAVAMTEPNRNGAPALLAALLSLLGVYIFWIDACKGKIYEGILRLVLILAMANLIIPCLFQPPSALPRRRRVEEEEADDEEDY